MMRSLGRDSKRSPTAELSARGARTRVRLTSVAPQYCSVKKIIPFRRGGATRTLEILDEQTGEPLKRVWWRKAIQPD
ncbi:hypothetical protein [Brasilonema bromeliae]|uniref:hypothetical protein n=1 Tax=Brasilonema bromeliae TaxID=383615 RepID=UPI00145C4F47|nr:hypothetical protein [Brasilonema bromeliae]